MRSGARRQNILLMTATITPETSPEVERLDPALRLADYHQALSFYIGELGKSLDGIVFVENSDSDISSLVALAEDKGVYDSVEFIANYGKHSFPGRNRSFGESRLLDHAMRVSRLINEADEAAVIWKVTGRYQVLNLANMIRTAPPKFDLYCDMRTRPIPWADLRFMGWTRSGYARLLNGLPERLDTAPREPYVYVYLACLQDRSGIVPRFRREPLIEGVRAWDNRHYSRDLRERRKYWLRATVRRLAPFVWI